MKFNNCKLQPGISSLRAKFREMRAEYLDAVFPHMGEQSQKYRTKKPADRRQQEMYNCVYVFIFVPLHKEQSKNP